ncbi:MAG: hypothetical protein RH945_08630 [Hyphomonas sp.]
MRLVIAIMATLLIAVPAIADCGNYEQQLAHNYVKQHAKAHLQSPRSAKFPFSPAQKVLESRGGACVVTLGSWVDARNAFNAEIRRNYVAEVKISGNKVEITQFGFTN